MTEAGTRFAILQRRLEIPDAEKLKRAFRSVHGLTNSDAYTLANDAFGILVNNLSPTDAMTLQGALRAEGVETAVVLQHDLPQLPPTKFVHQISEQARVPRGDYLDAVADGERATARPLSLESKLQNPNTKPQRSSKLQPLRWSDSLRFEASNFSGAWCLVFGACGQHAVRRGSVQLGAAIRMPPERGYPGGQPMWRPPRTWQCKCGTDSPPSGPLLMTSR